MKKRVALLVGGPEKMIPDFSQIEAIETEWIGVDRGTLRLLAKGIKPVISLGDFDSITSEELRSIQEQIHDVRISKAEKDETDTEMAVAVALNELKADEVIIYGATAGRVDHLLANLWMVLQPRFKPHASKIKLVDTQNTITFYLPGEYEISKEANKKYLAFVGLTAIKKLTLYDEKYQLTEANFDYPISLASNEFVGETGRFSFVEGVLAVIQSKD
ncbi:thiamine diphosphokinase [Carnobacterium gallinarum]|uniref:thiamine diphosphokinase n=1 Tax=Carnobacterium gallinarum TaxID=2749 RepID=UPI0005528BA0|nr:thiamine diphosphokinase [Carnobacterium gallinarum]